jgi:hypothetical protein
MKQKRIILVLLIVIIALNINFQGSAGNQNNSLQWFPSLAADNGTVYIVWADERNGNYTRIMNGQPHKSGDIYFSKGSFQDGWIFDENIRINDIKGSTGHGSPSIRLDNNYLYVVWEDDRFGFEEIYFAYSLKNSINFSRDSQVVSEPESKVLPSIAVKNKTVYVSIMNKNNWDIEFTEGHSINGIYRFEKPARVNDDPAGNWHYAPSIVAADENNIYITWLDARNNNYDIYFSHAKKESGNWYFGKNIKVNDDAVNASQYTPSIVYDNGSVYIVWYDDRNGDLDIYLSTGRFKNNRWEFGSNIRVNDDPGNSAQMHPEIAVSKDEIFISWEDEREGDFNIYFSNGRMKNGSFGFSKNIKVNDAGGNHFSPKIKAVGESVYLVWQAEVNDSGDIYFSQGKYNGKNWEFSTNIKVNDDITYSFTKPSRLFPGLILLSMVSAMVLVVLLRGKYEK